MLDMQNISEPDQINYKIETQNINPQNLLISDNRQRVIQIKDNLIFVKIKSEQQSDF